LPFEYRSAAEVEDLLDQVGGVGRNIGSAAYGQLSIASVMLSLVRC